MVQTRKAQHVVPEVETDASADDQEEEEVQITQQQATVYRRALLPEDIPPLFRIVPEETLEKAHSCIDKYGITGNHRVSDVSSKLHMQTFRGRQPPLNSNTTVYIAQVCWP